MKIYWLEQAEADLPKGGSGVPPGESHAQDGSAARPEWEWLGARERAQLNAMRFAKRRTDWQLGRWTAKHAVAACLHLPTDLPSLANIEVHAAPSGAPEIFLGNKWAPVTISLSHRDGKAICAVAPDGGALGCDLEVIEPHSDAFIGDYFTREEQQWVAQTAETDRPTLLTLLWSAKESALKALHAGLRLDTRSLIVTAENPLPLRDEDGAGCVQRVDAHNPDLAVRQPGAVRRWHPLRVRHVNDQTFLGWWQHTGNLLRTMVATPPPARPLLLNIRPKTSNGPSMAVSNGSQAA